MTRTTGCLVFSAAAALLALGGCQSNPNSVSLGSILADPTPELMATAERPVDMDVNAAVSRDQDLRGFWSDMGRFWLTTKPRPLSPYPIFSTTGQP